MEAGGRPEMLEGLRKLIPLPLSRYAYGARL